MQRKKDKNYYRIRKKTVADQTKYKKMLKACKMYSMTHNFILNSIWLAYKNSYSKGKQIDCK